MDNWVVGVTGVVSAVEAARLIGLPYSTFDHWARRGWVRFEIDGSGSGSRRALSVADIERGCVVKALVDAGALPRTVHLVAEAMAGWVTLPAFIVVSADRVDPVPADRVGDLPGLLAAPPLTGVLIVPVGPVCSHVAGGLAGDRW